MAQKIPSSNVDTQSRVSKVNFTDKNKNLYCRFWTFKQGKWFDHLYFPSQIQRNIVQRCARAQQAHRLLVADKSKWILEPFIPIMHIPISPPGCDNPLDEVGNPYLPHIEHRPFHNVLRIVAIIQKPSHATFIIHMSPMIELFWRYSVSCDINCINALQWGEWKLKKLPALYLYSNIINRRAPVGAKNDRPRDDGSLCCVLLLWVTASASAQRWYLSQASQAALV